MDITMDPMSPDDGESIMEIFNYYIENSFSAYPERKLPEEFFDVLLSMSQGYPTATVKKKRWRRNRIRTPAPVQYNARIFRRSGNHVFHKARVHGKGNRPGPSSAPYRRGQKKQSEKHPGQHIIP